MGQASLTPLIKQQGQLQIRYIAWRPSEKERINMGFMCRVYPKHHIKRLAAVLSQSHGTHQNSLAMTEINDKRAYAMLRRKTPRKETTSQRHYLHYHFDHPAPIPLYHNRHAFISTLHLGLRLPVRQSLLSHKRLPRLTLKRSRTTQSWARRWRWWRSQR